MLERWRREAAEQIDQEENREREERIGKLADELRRADEVSAGAKQNAAKRQAELDARVERDRKKLVEDFGEIGGQVHPLRNYHALSMEERRRYLLFASHERLTAARMVALRAGIGVDGWESHRQATGRRLSAEISGEIAAVEPSNDEIRDLARKLAEQGKKREKERRRVSV
jgi:hypothetical protein